MWDAEFDTKKEEQSDEGFGDWADFGQADEPKTEA